MSLHKFAVMTTGELLCVYWPSPHVFNIKLILNFEYYTEYQLYKFCKSIHSHRNPTSTSRLSSSDFRLISICRYHNMYVRAQLVLWLILMVWFRFMIMFNIKVDIRPSYESIVWASLLHQSRDGRHILCCRLADCWNMSRRGIAARASRYSFIQFYRVNITSGTFLHWWSIFLEDILWSKSWTENWNIIHPCSEFQMCQFISWGWFDF